MERPPHITLTLGDTVALGDAVAFCSWTPAERADVILEGCAGEWDITAVKHGSVVVELQMVRAGINTEAFEFDENFSGRIRVDSGAVLVVDANAHRTPIEFASVEATLDSPEGHGVPDGVAGYATSSGLGDSVYPVYVERTAQGVPARICVEFVTEDELD